MTKNIKDWKELSKLEPSKTHRVAVNLETGKGWIVELETNEPVVYLSTHTFFKNSGTTNMLKEYGWDVTLGALDNCNQPSKMVVGINKNAKKLFEMLDVEVNEKFKLENISTGYSNNKMYYINEKLKLIEDRSEYTPLSVIKILNGEQRIIKLPKKPTIKELADWRPTKDNTKVWYLGIDLDILFFYFRKNDTSDYFYEKLEDRMEYNKVFPTEEMAQRYKNIKEAHINLGHVFSIQEWADKSILKYSLYINHSSKSIEKNNNHYIQNNKYTFMTYEARDKFIEFVGSYEDACLFLDL